LIEIETVASVGALSAAFPARRLSASVLSAGVAAVTGVAGLRPKPSALAMGRASLRITWISTEGGRSRGVVNPIRFCIHRTLHGYGKGRKGLVAQVEELITAADRGCFSLRLVLWLGGGIVAAVTAISQFKQAVTELFHQ
jgi:hypothetical protein